MNALGEVTLHLIRLFRSYAKNSIEQKFQRVNDKGKSAYYRMLRGGLWLQFHTGEWSRCAWSKEHEGYIMNPHDGGMFHVKFNGIIDIEDYFYGHGK